MTEVTSMRPIEPALASAPRGLRLAVPAFRLREEHANDVAAREALLDASFGPTRLAKTCERLREGRMAAEGLSLVAAQGADLIGTLRFWHIKAGGRDALMLGPLAVSARHRSLGVGRAMIDQGLRQARKLGHRSVILVGDAPYYERFGFSRQFTLGLTLPGPVDEDRFLGLELVPGALAGAEGPVVGTGLPALPRGRDRLRLAA